ncbi:TcaA NTF2-like domain-containing protein [Bacillus cereus]|uniref:TcaA NTF2-like domain-containing protein n=1 Tax=Bacillus cereus TaxID=1396 RepID=UPI000B4A339C|nr:hypothetical protein [Bacillus cereus]
MSSEKKSRGVKTLIGVIIVSGTALFGFLNSGLSFLNSGIDTWNKIFTKNSSQETAQQQSEVSEKTKNFSEIDIKDFLDKYNFASVSAQNQGDFDEVKDYLDPEGTAYNEQLRDINKHSTPMTDITQKNPNTNILRIEETSSTYKVSTSEKYDIYKEGIKEKTDQYYHQYILIVDKSNKLKVNEHIFRKDPPY